MLTIRIILTILLAIALGPCDALSQTKGASEEASMTSRSCPGPIEYQEVWTAEDLALITVAMLEDNSPALRYRQCADIVLPSDGFFPLGHHSSGQIAAGGFQGEYLGQGFRISGHTAPAGFAAPFGLFRRLNGARISDLTVENTIYHGSYSAGALASHIMDSDLQGISIVNASLHSTASDTGALAGAIFGSALQSIRIQALVGSCAGVTRSISNSTIQDLHVSITRNSASPITRFAGIAENIGDSTLGRVVISLNAEDSHSLQEIAGVAIETLRSTLSDVVVRDSLLPSVSSRAAGLVAKALPGTVIQRANVSLSLQADWQAGGLVARSEGAHISDSLYVGSLSSGWAAGGIVGSGSIGSSSAGAAATSIERCAVRHSQITGVGPVGGIVGELYSSGLGQSMVADSYVLASIQSSSLPTDYSNLGGIAGLPYGSFLNRVLFSGSIAGGEYVGGITGVPFLDSTVRSAIYNSDLVTSSNGEGTPAPQSAMMQNASLYSSFDLVQTWSFSIGSYPALRSINNLLVDVNGDLEVTNADLFGFLAFYFGASLYADFDGSGTLAVTDIFAFLNAWFDRL